MGLRERVRKCRRGERRRMGERRSGDLQIYYICCIAMSMYREEWVNDLCYETTNVTRHI